MTAPLDDILVDDLPAARASLRIAMVTETYPPEVNGVSRTVASVVQGLRQRGHQLQLVRPSQKAEARPAPDAAGEAAAFHEVLMRGLPIPRYPQLRMGLPSRRALVALWSRQRPDVVHIATEGPLGWSALQAARQLKLPVCSDFRTNFQAYSRHYGVGWLHKPILAYLRRFHNHTACTMTPDAGLGQTLTGHGFRDVVVVARGVDTEAFHPRHRSDALRAQWGAAPQDPVLLHVGRLAPEKNLAALVQAYEAARRVHPRTRLVLVGDGPAARELRARMPDAVFAGMRHGEDLAAHYASGDLFVFPSQSETYGNVTPEALASGLPVLAFDYAAAGQLVQPGCSGALVALDDAEGFAAAAAQLVRDPAGLVAMKPAAREAVAALDWAQIIDRVEAVYARVMQASPRPQAEARPKEALGFLKPLPRPRGASARSVPP